MAALVLTQEQTSAVYAPAVTMENGVSWVSKHLFHSTSSKKFDYNTDANHSNLVQMNLRVLTEGKSGLRSQNTY